MEGGTSVTEIASRAGQATDSVGVIVEAARPRTALGQPFEVDIVRRAFCRQGRLQAALKRGLDVAFATVLLLILSPVFIVIAAVLAWHLRRSPIFAHERVGRGGVTFRCLKFRTMRDAEAEEAQIAHASFKAGTDTRTTRVTRWLRRTSLDELPQLINVLTGEMSIVGPRPVVPDELRMYFGSLSALLLTVRPGMTGLWAVSGRSNIEYPERAAIELRYVTRVSLWLDMRILAQTLFAVARARGAM